MQDQTNNLHVGAGDPERTIVDPEKTLVAPRFDAREASTAQPVVPLAESPAARRELRPGTLPLVLILISALVGGLVSVFAYRLYQQRAQTSARAEQQPSAGESPAPTPQQQTEPTPGLSEAAVTESPEATPEAIAESAPANAEAAEVREEEAVPVEESPARAEAREDRAGRDLEAARAARTAREERPAARTAPEGGRVVRQPRARRVEEINTPTRDMGVRAQRRDERAARGDEAPARPQANRRAAGRERPQRNIDRVRAIFEGAPPAP